MRRVVFDTSTLVSAALRRGSIPDQALLLASRFCEICISLETLDELREVLARDKFDRYLAKDAREDFIRFVGNSARLFVVRDDDVSGVQPPCRDARDNQFLALAFEAEAEAIVSSDADLLVLHPWNDIQIFRPSEFVDMISRDGSSSQNGQ